MYLTKSIKNKKDGKDEEEEEEGTGRDKPPTRITLAGPTVKLIWDVLRRPLTVPGTQSPAIPGGNNNI